MTNEEGKKRKALVVSIDHIYGFGWRALVLMQKLKEELAAQSAFTIEHSIPDLPRALLQGADFLAKKPHIAERFWFDFYRELMAKAKICDKIREDIRLAQERKFPTVIFCKNFNGTNVHAAMHQKNFYNLGMDALEAAARCGDDLSEVQDPIAPDVNILLKINSEVAYETYRQSLAEILEKLNGSPAHRKVKKLFARLDFFSQQPAYLAEFERLGEKGYIIDANGTDEDVLAEMSEIIVQKIKN